MGRPVNANGRQTREAVLDAALELFAEKGYFGTSLRDIAAAVGVRESALYNYFPSKEHLFDALLTPSAERVEQLTGRFDEPITDARVTLTRLATEAIDHYCTGREVQRFRMLMADGLRLARAGRINLLDRMSAGQARMRSLMLRLTKEGWLRRGDPDAYALAFFGPLLWWRHLHAAGSDHPAVIDRQAFVRAHVNQFLHGAGAVAATRHRAGTISRRPPSPARPRPKRRGAATDR